MEHSTRWARIVDVLDDASLYTEDAERLFPTGVRLPTDPLARAKALHELAELVNDKIMFYNVTQERPHGVLEADMWVDGAHVNAILREKGYR